MKKRFLLLASFLFLGTTLANIAKAVCPICVVAVGTGLGFSRWIGVDDVISSIWIGALLISTSMWTLTWLKIKGWEFKYSRFIVPTAFYLLTLVPLYFAGIIGHPLNQIFGIDKIIFGTVTGTIIFMASVWLHNYLKRKNNFKSFFPYQKVVLPVLILIIISLILWKII